ncbi:hypothetical protein MBLNU13_g02009t1 [Cladosporium sp. NU13]
MPPPPNPPNQLRHIKPGHPSDRYWRLPDYVLSNQVSEIRHHLRAHNYPHTGPSSDFASLLQSLACSLLGYEKCKTAELRLFAQQRRLTTITDIPCGCISLAIYAGGILRGAVQFSALNRSPGY